MKLAILLLSGGQIHRGAEHSMIMLAEDLTQLGVDVTIFQAGPSTQPWIKQIKLPFNPTSHRPSGLIGKILCRLYLDPRSLMTIHFTLSTLHLLHDFDVIIPTDGFWQVLILKSIIWLKSFRFVHRTSYLVPTKLLCVGLAGLGFSDRDVLKLNPDHFVALTAHGQAWARSINSKVKTSIIPLQVDLSLYQHPESYPLQLKSPIVLTVAALTPYKRVDSVIKAVAQIPHCSLLIVGQGELFLELKKLADNLLPNRHQFLSIPFSALPSVYHQAAVFTLASEPTEAFGQVLVEAMAANLPVVTTDDPVRREIVGDSGYFVNPTNQELYISTLTQALTRDSKLDTRDYNISPFSRSTVANQYHQLLTSLVE